MAKVKQPGTTPSLDALMGVLDARVGIYKNLRGAADVRSYLGIKGDRADEEILTEPVLAAILEQVLGFPTDAYFPQLGKSGLKPDFTPVDLIAHRFVLDAKSSNEDLGRHEKQIREYVHQRRLDFGVLFNLREVRVYRRLESGHASDLSFPLIPLWEAARGEALPGVEVDHFRRFCELFAYREMDFGAKVRHIREQLPWEQQPGEDVKVDIEFLVDRLRALSRELVEDAAAQMDRLDAFLRFNPGRDAKLLGELRLIALDISPGVDLAQLPSSIADWRDEPGVAARAWRQYLLRVAYLALARVLLYRSWEDVQFVKQYLYDGGFGTAYDHLSESVEEVLETAFQRGAGQYHWLYGQQNNYDWYRPREEALVDVLYSLAPVPLGKLDADVLGGLYVSYVDEIDRDRLGQFFTPRAVVKFMLDRAGFAGPEGVFRIEGDTRHPRKILDFATGSGGFLVEAARRIIDDGGVRRDDVREIEEALAAIVRGFVGGEISPFPYYLTEVNLLLQVSRLLGDLSLEGQRPPSFALGVLHVDTLTAKSGAASIEGIEPEHRADKADLVQDERFDLVPLDGEKLETYRSDLRRDATFDLVIGNPPYVTEANNKPLFDRLRAIPAWQSIYRGKTDYLYYFLWLAVEKLVPGGRLCVITPAGWMNAGAADFLREKLAGELTIEELFLFGSHRLFAAEQGPAPTPTVESAILVATKKAPRTNHKLRVVALEDESEAARQLTKNPEARLPERTALLAEMARRARGKAGRRNGIHVHDLPQAELSPERPWPVKFGAEDIAARTVAHLQRMLEDESSPVEPLEASWHVFQGIQSGADAYTARIQRRLDAATRSRLEAEGVRTGDPILELQAGAEQEPPWKDARHLLARSVEPRAILYGALDDADYTHIVRLVRGRDVPRPVIDALERWRPVLATRAEIARNPRREWWETAWPRNDQLINAPKVISLYRTDRGRFALDETGQWQPSIKTTLVVGREDDAPVAYLCGVLNSELLDLWYAVRGKTPWHVRRNYEPKRMNEMPYRRPEGDPRADEIAELVRKVAANRRALLPHRSVVRDLGRIVKDPWKTGPVQVDRAALVGELPTKDTISVRLDPALELKEISSPIGRPEVASPDTLIFRRARMETAHIVGEPRRVALLKELVEAAAPGDLGGVTLPRDLDAFEKAAEERAHLIATLLSEGRELVKQVERLVCTLYELSDELTDEVVAHAVNRAGSSEPA